MVETEGYTMAHVKTVTTTLDSLPAGAGPEILENGKLKKVSLPQGVTRKMLLKDIILIAWPSLVELLLTQLTSMADQVMVDMPRMSISMRLTKPRIMGHFKNGNFSLID